MRYRNFVLLGLLALTAVPAFASSGNGLKSDIKDNGRGIITNYGNMQEGSDVQWYWIAPGAKLSSYRCKVGTVKNLTTIVDHGLRDTLKSDVPAVFNRDCSSAKGAKSLTVDVGVYWAERANRHKAWIPFAGAHLAQAGVGIEMVFHDASGKIIAKLRDSGREGSKLGEAADDVLDDISKFIHDH
ncbi:MAG TPA: hypothetical protein VF269_05260 [Rhodanobacteraceae bacterium]